MIRRGSCGLQKSWVSSQPVRESPARHSPPQRVVNLYNNQSRKLVHVLLYVSCSCSCGFSGPFDRRANRLSSHSGFCLEAVLSMAIARNEYSAKKSDCNHWLYKFATFYQYLQTDLGKSPARLRDDSHSLFQLPL
jgi:hypothetical protein